MVRRTPILIVASLVLLAAGVAAANNLLAGPSPGLAGPSPGLSVSAESVVAQSSTPSTTTPSTVVPSTGTTTGTTTTGATTTNGATTTTGTTTNGTTTNGTVTAPTGTLAIDQIVSITRSVAPGNPVAAFTVPAGQVLVITDVLVTNPGISPACGAAVSPGETTTVADGTTATSTIREAGTGPLCVQAQTSLDIGLTTGMEFTSGQSVVLANASVATEGATTGPTTLRYRLGGFLMSASGT